MTEFSFIRHAESVANLHPEIVGGRRNPAELTDVGIKQAMKLGASLLHRSYVPDEVFVSPAVRARQTALGVFGGDFPFEYDDRLLEMTHGKAEGKLRDQVYTQDVIRERERMGKNFRLGDDAESVNDVALRMIDFLREKSEAHHSAKIAVVSHGIAIKSLVAHIENHSQEWIYKTPLVNASITTLITSDEEIIVASVGQEYA